MNDILGVNVVAPCSTKEQSDFIIKYMSENPALLNPTFLKTNNGKVRGPILWENLAYHINKLGPPKSALEWRKYWSNKKYKTSDKYKNLHPTKKTSKITDVRKQVITLFKAEDKQVDEYEFRTLGMIKDELNCQPSKTSMDYSLQNALLVHNVEAVLEDLENEQVMENGSTPDENFDFTSNGNIMNSTFVEKESVPNENENLISSSNLNNFINMENNEPNEFQKKVFVVLNEIKEKISGSIIKILNETQNDRLKIQEAIEIKHIELALLKKKNQLKFRELDLESKKLKQAKLNSKRSNLENETSQAKDKANLENQENENVSFSQRGRKRKLVVQQ